MHDSFQPTLYLGASINMLHNDAQIFDFTQIFNHPEIIFTEDEKRGVLAGKTRTDRDLGGIFGTLKDIPTSININIDERSGQTDLLTFESGSKVINALKTEASFEAGYMGVTGGISTTYSASSEFTDDNQYAFYNVERSGYTASFINFNDVNQTMIKDAKNLPEYDPTMDSIRAQYHKFFAIYGTHVITNMQAGWRLQQQIVQSNQSQADKTNFGLNIKVAYMGSSLSGSGLTEQEVQTFEKNSKITTITIGGQGGVSYANDPTDQSAKKKFEASFGVRNDVGTTGIGVESLGWLLYRFGEHAAGDELDKAIYDLSKLTYRSIIWSPFESMNIFPYKSYGPDGQFFGSLTWSLKTPDCVFMIKESPDGTQTVQATEWNQTASVRDEAENYWIGDPLPPIRCAAVDTIQLQLTGSAEHSGYPDFTVELPAFANVSPQSKRYLQTNQDGKYGYEGDWSLQVNVAKYAPWLNR